LSKTFLHVHNLPQTAIRWLVLKYSDAAPGDTGQQAFYLVDVGSPKAHDVNVFIVDLFVPAAMFFEGRVPIWSIDIIDAF
jgi:hypothetical protein